ncbi:MAG: ATP-binding protein [Bacteroidota bacterium]
MNPERYNDSTITKRINWIALGSMILLSLYFVSSSYLTKLDAKEQSHLKLLKSIAQTLSMQIDGDEYSQLLERFPQQDDIRHNGQDSIYRKISRTMRDLQVTKGLQTPIYILSKSSGNNNFFFGVTSADQPYYRHAYVNPPSLISEKYEEGGQMGQYKSQQGNWLSAFMPLKNSQGNVVGVIEVDEKLAHFNASAKQDLYRDTLMALLAIFCCSLILRKYLNRVISMLKDKEVAEHKAMVKAKFLSTMSHEIRTPMNAVIGLSNILIQEEPRKDQLENLKTLKFSADLLLALINDILDFSKIEAGKISFEKIDFNLHDLVENIQHSLAMRAKDKGIQLDLQIKSDVPQFVVGDPVRLSQILTNLCGNAIKFTNEGKVSIEMELLFVDQKQAKIRFSVIDTGIGIPKDKFETIFKSFSQADTTTTRKYGGTGLGLSITKRLLELQNSNIQIQSEVGKGSTFFFDLQLPIGQGPQLSECSQEVVHVPESLEGARVLLVEDNRINVIVAGKFLKKWGLVYDVAENGQIAVEMVQQKDYHAILMDLDMPVMDGYKATQAIRALADPKFQEVPIIALSASALSNFREKAFEAGMNEFVTKPFNPSELYQTLGKFVRIEQEV